MLLIKFIKVQNLTYSEFKHYKTILMLCKKIEIDQSKRFTQIIETKIYELQRFPQIRMGINISVFLSESYIQKKNPSFDSVTQIYTEFRNFISFLSAKRKL